MSLADLLSPTAVAIVGASDDPTRIGGRPIKYMREFGFEGRVLPVNPKRDVVQGLTAYPGIDAIEGNIDFALIATPAATVPGALRAAAAKGAKAAMVFSSGFREVGAEGEALESEALAAAREGGVRLIGPNCLGGFNAGTGFTPCFSATLERGRPAPGGLGIASQSGAYGSHIYYQARQRGLGTQYLLTTGNEADVSVPEVIGLMAEDDAVHCILAYCEGVQDGERLCASLEAARAAGKPVIVMKVGRSEVGAAAAASHTASLAGEDAVYDAVLRQYGAHRARTTEEALDIAYAARPRIYPRGRRVGLVTISGGAGVLMADAAEAEGLDVAPMPEATQARLKARLPFASPRNPVDVTAQSFNDFTLVTDFVKAMLEEGEYDSVVAFWTTVAGSASNAGPLKAALAEAVKGHEGALMVQSLIAEPEIVKGYEAEGYPVFEDPSRAVSAAAALTRFGESFARGAREVPAMPAAAGLPEGPLGEREARALLASAGLPMAEDRLVETPEAAEAAAREMGGRVALKVASPDILHKTEVGGVALDVPPEGAAEAFAAMMQAVAKAAPLAKIEGALVSPMLPSGVDLILGAKLDPVFGPVVMVGLGGVFAEVLRDVAFRRAPVAPAEAEAMLRELKGVALLEGARGAPPCDIGAVAAAVSALSVFAAAERPASVEINPLRAFPGAAPAPCLGLDALIERG